MDKGGRGVPRPHTGQTTQSSSVESTHKRRERQQADYGLLPDDLTRCIGTLLHLRVQCYES